MDCSTAITKHPKDPNFITTTAPVTTISAISNICNSESYTVFPSLHHELVSANSIELNGATSLSDDSGVPLTTNSSISSGDSYRLGMCKFEIELAESDGEVSQFDSLDNCSESGMSAENFNTLKKGPLALIDPPPEFQDSPKTTLVRSTIKCSSGGCNNVNGVSNLRRWTSSQSSFEHLKDNIANDSLTTTKINGCDNTVDDDNNSIIDSHEERTLKELYAASKHLYSSDSILNIHIDNIYDEPNNILSSSLGNSATESQSPLPSPPPPVSIVKIKRTMCPFYQDHTRYFKAIPSEQDNLSSTTKATNAAATLTRAESHFNHIGLSDIYDYDMYCGFRWNTTTATTYQYDYTLQRKPMYSPINNTHHHYHNHIYHGSISGCNRPNSRNSLNGRLSSSHNSLNTSSANKPDDSIFITQAMSHDALLTREISDFYNVPIDSDIYAFPVDMINADKPYHSYNTYKYQTLKSTTQQLICRNNHKDNHIKQLRENNNQQKLVCKQAYKQKKHFHCSMDNCDNSEILTAAKSTNSPSIITYTPTLLSTFNANKLDKNTEHFIINNNKRESSSLQLDLNGVNQFYNTIYSETKSNTNDIIMQARHVIKNQITNKQTNQTKCSSENNNWTSPSIRSFASAGSGGNANITNTTTSTRHVDKIFGPVVGSCIKNCKNQKDNCITDKDKTNNNNNNNSASYNNNNNVISTNNHNIKVADNVIINEMKHSTKHDNKQQQHNNIIDTSGSKPNVVTPIDKKAPFSLNLKEKFCSIFRFRRNQNRCRSTTNNEQICQLVRSNDDNRKKLQFRALPPLPNKDEKHATRQSNDTLEQKGKKSATEITRPLQFTSSIEKVKDYGWYWGPLSSEAAEKVLSNEPDGSFIVRDSSDDHYIFSLSFKLNNCVRHVRIEQDQGTFSFGCYAKFKSQTITEFVEKAVEHSRSGRYLFFLHRRPEHGPLRVQLTNPVSRFKHVQSLQHMCRFVILKVVVRKDLIQTLPLPRRLLDYLNYKHCYSEQVETDSSTSQVSEDEFL